MFRPCIDLHEGRVKQIVGSTLSADPSTLKTNFVSPHDPVWYAELYRRDNLRGGHIIMLGSGNENAARKALAAYPGGMQIGGGVNPTNAKAYLDFGASHVIVTSWIFHGGELDWERLRELSRAIGRDRLVLDLSCRKRAGEYYVVTDRWQTFTDVVISKDVLGRLGDFCVEFLVHAVDVEGLSQGIDLLLVEQLADMSPLPVTYAGGAKSITDLHDVERVGRGNVHLTIGSALDIFGGGSIRYDDAVAFNRSRLSKVGGFDH